MVAPRHAYNGTVTQLADLQARGRLTARLVDVTDTAAVVAACDDAALVWLESPTNPALEVADIETVARAAHDAGAYVVVDNTFATPLRQQPLSLGADIVVHSATKYLSGHGDAMLGAVVTSDDQVYDVLKGRRDLVGAVPGTLEAWLALRGVRTLHLRTRTCREQCSHVGRAPARAPCCVGGALPRLRRDRRDRARRRRGRRATGWSGPRRCGCTPRRSAASSRRSSDAGGGSRSPRRSPTGSSVSASASRTSRICGRTSAEALDLLT